MKIKRLYTKPGQDVFDTAKYRLMSSVIRAADGNVISNMHDIEMPEHWSQNACDIFAHKYLRKAGVPEKWMSVPESGVPVWLQRSIPKENAKLGGEKSVKDAIRRVAGCWAYHGWKGGYFDSEEDALAFFDEVKYMLLHQVCSPNSPQWFNTGLHWAHGITGVGAGHYHYCPKEKSIVRAKTAYEHPQVHACFILDVEDNLIGKDGIMETWMKEAAIFKYGSGAGANFSNLRGAGEALSGGGKSSGLMSFLKIGDTAAGAIKSGGTTRRAAKMVILNDDHPDIEEFVTWKVNEEQKVLSLVLGSMLGKKHIKNIQKACEKWNDEETKYDVKGNPYLQIALMNAQKSGVAASYCNHVLYALKNKLTLDFEEFSYDWNSEAYRAVSGQNSNNSVRVTDKFIRAIKENADWELKARVDDKTIKTIKARDLWKQICYSAWSCADPGVQYEDTIHSWHTCKESGRITATNPCSEYVFLDNTACNLASINLDKMVSVENGKIHFETEKFQHAARLLTIALEISVFMAQYPTYDIAFKSYQFRTLGLGYASLGSVLMKCGLAYDSEEGRDLASAITSLMTWTAYDTSADLARDLGSFEEYEKNKDSFISVLEHMKNATDGVTFKGKLEEEEGEDRLDKICMIDMSQDSRFIGMNVPYQILQEGPLPEISKTACQLAGTVIDKVRKTGVRNAQTTLIAPTGTISFVMDCGTTACEPSFSLVSWKKLAGGGDMRVLNPEVVKALEALGYDNKQVADMKGYVFGYGSLQNAPEINNQVLIEKGFTTDMLETMNNALQNCYHISHVFNVRLFGLDNLNKIIPGIREDADVLKELGFKADQIKQANLHCCGHLTMEGAPHLKDEHVSIFDCAVNNGAGVRSISPMGHVKMLAAIQPFISGASSKTVNMPEEATVEEISDIYLNAWSMGVKCIAIYRNNSKFSQALNVTHFGAESEEEVGGKAYRYGMRLSGSPFYVLTQEKADGTLAELEVVMGKEGSSFRILMDCFAQAISLGLKHNIPLRKYVDAFKNTAFEPDGIVEGYTGIAKALSPLDLLARVLEKEYAHREKFKPHYNVLQMSQTCTSKRATVTIDGHQFTLHTGETVEGQLGEVFFKMSKEGSAFCSLMSNFAKAISIALQAGVPFENIYRTFIGMKFDPYGMIEGHSKIRSANSVIDFAFKCLALWYQPELLDYSANGISAKFDAKSSHTVQANENESSRPCPKCYGFSLVVNGSCYVCTNCGETTGCG